MWKYVTSPIKTFFDVCNHYGSGITAIATVILVLVTWRYVWLTQNILTTQIEPAIDFYVLAHEKEVLITNNGPYPVLNVSIVIEFLVFDVNQPHNPMVRVATVIDRPLPTKSIWWSIEELLPGKTQKQSLKDVVETAVQHTLFAKEQFAKPQSSPYKLLSDDLNLQTFINFHLIYHRDVDQRRFTKLKTVWLSIHEGGHPVLTNIEMVRHFSSLQEMIKKAQESYYFVTP